jgi:uncharacterized cupin superfamily protein
MVKAIEVCYSSFAWQDWKILAIDMVGEVMFATATAIVTTPGVQVIKAGTPEMIELAERCNLPALKSQIIDIPLTEHAEALTVGRFAIQSPSADLPYQYDILEAKVVLTGCVRVQDGEGTVHQADVGDIILFTPPTPVTFLGDSDGTYFYIAHRPQEPLFSESEPDLSFASAAPGVYLVKAETPTLVDLSERVAMPALKSQIIDIPLTTNLEALTIGRFAFQESVDLPYESNILETKIILSGKIRVQDEQGIIYEGAAGDIFVFVPPTRVIFLSDSDGMAVYAAHRSQEPLFCP